jgi:hypothetical protein
MKLKCYSEFPTDIDLDHDDIVSTRSDVLAHSTSVELYRALKRQYTDIEIEPINSWYTHPGTCFNDKYNTAWFIIENPENKKYIAINLQCDTAEGMLAWDLENCIQLLTGVGVQSNNSTYVVSTKLQYTPATFTTFYKSAYNLIEEIYQRNIPKKLPDKLFFIGGSYLFREWLYLNDNRFYMRPDKISRELFIEELGNSSINIDINGMAEVSCRTLDIMGMGSALIRPKLGIQYHNPLIPDYHYAQVYCDDLSDYNKLADAYISRFEDLKKDRDLVQFLSENGRRWYEENATIEAYVKIHTKLMNLYDLQ